MQRMGIVPPAAPVSSASKGIYDALFVGNLTPSHVAALDKLFPIWAFFSLTYVWYKLKAIAVLALSPMVVPKAVAAGCSCRVAGMQEAALIV